MTNAGRTRELLLVGAIILAGTLLFQRSGEYVTGAFNDDGVYVSLGKAIATGQGYHSIYMPGDPVQVKYPPGLPALFALLWLVGGSLANVAVLIRLLSLVVVSGTCVTLWWYGRTVLQVSRLPLAVCVLGPFFLEASLNYFGLAISEPYYLLGWAWALVLQHAVTEAETPAVRTRKALWLGLVLAATTLFRSQAIVLIPAILLALALRRAGKAPLLTCAAAAVIPLAAWRLLRGVWEAKGPVSTLPDEVNYGAWLDLGSMDALVEFAQRVLWHNVVTYTRIFGYYATEHATTIGLGVVCLGLLLAGIGALHARREPVALPLTAAASLGAALAWPWAQDRLVLVSIPFLGLLAALALTRWMRRGGSAVRLGLAAVLVLCAGALAWRQYELRRATLSVLAGKPASVQPFLPTFFLSMNGRYVEDVSSWVRVNTRPDDRILVELPAGVYLLTGRKAVGSRPPQSRIQESAFARPGEYLARRILEENMNVLALGNPAFAIAADIRQVMSACPQVLQFRAQRADGGYPVFFTIRRDETCLRERVLARSAPR